MWPTYYPAYSFFRWCKGITCKKLLIFLVHSHLVWDERLCWSQRHPDSIKIVHQTYGWNSVTKDFLGCPGEQRKTKLVSLFIFKYIEQNTQLLIYCYFLLMYFYFYFAILSFLCIQTGDLWQFRPGMATQ